MQSSNKLPENCKPATQEERQQLINRAAAAHRSVCTAVRTILPYALDAGDALILLKAGAGHGAWEGILRKCEIGDRTARVYMKLARNRAELESNVQRAADLSLRGALRLIGAGRERAGGSTRTGPAAAPALSSLDWSTATIEDRRDFLDKVGLQSVLDAMPMSWRGPLKDFVLKGFRDCRPAPRQIELTATEISGAPASGEPSTSSVTVNGNGVCA